MTNRKIGTTQTVVYERQYMPLSSGISQWCQQWGRPNKDWFAFVSIYNTGRNLLYVQNLPPFMYISERCKWRWLKYSEFNPNGVPEKDRELNGIVVLDHFGHEKTTNTASMVIRCGLSCSGIIKIHQAHILHVIGTMNSGIQAVLEYRPLPVHYFVQALSRW